MSKEKRYVVTIEMYVWAETDEEAINESIEAAHEINRAEDNGCAVVSVVEQPAGTIGNRHVYGKKD